MQTVELAGNICALGSVNPLYKFQVTVGFLDKEKNFLP
jgi:hypothetical protein